LNAARKNFWTAIVAAGICVVLLIVIAGLSINRATDFLHQRPSTFFTDPTGARALLLVLQRVLPNAGQWRRPFMDLPSEAGSTRSTLIVMGPQEPLSESDATALDRWITSGGQLILATNMEWQIRKPNKAGEKEEFIPLGYLARHSLKVKPDATGNDAIAAVTTKALGTGRIVFIPDSYAFSNESLGSTDDAVWIVSQVSEWGGAALIDEYHQGFGEKRELHTLVAMFAASPWGFACMQLALAGVVYILGCRRRFGRPVDELPVERTSPIEAVEALGGLFETARAGALSVRTVHQYLNLQLTAMFGYSVDLSNPAVRDRIASRSSVSKAELESYAEAVKRAIDGETTSDADLIRIARDATTISRSFSHGNARQHPGRPAAAG